MVVVVLVVEADLMGVRVFMGGAVVVVLVAVLDVLVIVLAMRVSVDSAVVVVLVAVDVAHGRSWARVPVADGRGGPSCPTAPLVS